MFHFHKIFRNAFYITRKIYQIRNYAKKRVFTFDNPCYTLVRVTPNDYDDVIQFWKKYYVPDEPLFVAASIFKNNSVLEQSVMETICQGLSLMVRCRNDGSIIAAAINGTVCPWDADLKDKLAKHVKCKKTAQVEKFHAHLLRAPDLYNKYCIIKIFELMYLVTKREKRGKGIGTNLVEASRELCRDMSIPVFRVDCTSEFTSRICKKLGYTLELEMPWDSYLDEEGKPLFYPPPPHKIIRIYVDFPLYRTLV